jgi:hypothetical protein
MRHQLPICGALLAATWFAATAPSRAQAPSTAPAKPQVSPAVAELMEPVQPAAGDNRLRKLLKEHHNTAVRFLQSRVESYRNGMTDAASVFEAAKLVADAKSDLAQDDREREAVLQQVLAVTQDVERRLESQFQSGVGSEANFIRARLARESAEIELLKFKQQHQSAAAPTTRPR